MSSFIKVTLVKDTISPDLARKARALGPDGRQAILLALGAELVSITQGAFKDSALRPLVWPALKSRKGMPLIKTQQMLRGIHISELTSEHVTVQPTVPYAVHHQLGAPKAHIPPRPFFPFTPGASEPVAFAKARLDAVARAAIERLLTG